MNPTNEPVRLGATIIGAIGAILAVLVAFGVDLSITQQEAIIAAVAALIALASAIGVGEWVRRRVTPTADPKDDQGRNLVPMEEWTPE